MLLFKAVRKNIFMAYFKKYFFKVKCAKKAGNVFGCKSNEKIH